MLILKVTSRNYTYKIEQFMDIVKLQIFVFFFLKFLKVLILKFLLNRIMMFQTLFSYSSLLALRRTKFHLKQQLI